jgi:hypothetical protein
MNRSWWVVLPALLLTLSACSTQPRGMSHEAPVAADRVVLYDGLGVHSYRITTASAEAQRWFDQGLRLLYAFNHNEAHKAFREAARLDPACAMCYWGIAMTQGSNYNSPTDPDRERAALAAVQQAQRLAAGATPPERALIQALARRHSADPSAKREALPSSASSPETPTTPEPCISTSTPSRRAPSPAGPRRRPTGWPT